jgi:hypothetical protein
MTQEIIAEKKVSDTNSTPAYSIVLKQTGLVLLHVLPLLLASTAFTLITFPFGSHSFTWNYLDLSYHNGWGYTYHSEYSVLQVITYLFAYATGVVLYPILTRPRPLALFAAVICLAGFISFAIELTHWLFDHHLSLIASFPIIVLPIALWTVISLSLHKPGSRLRPM